MSKNWQTLSKINKIRQLSYSNFVFFLFFKLNNKQFLDGLIAKFFETIVLILYMYYQIRTNTQNSGTTSKILYPG